MNQYIKKIKKIKENLMHKNKHKIIVLLAIIIVFLMLFMFAGPNLTKKVLSRDDFNQNVKTGLTTTSAIFKVEEEGNEESDGTTLYKYKLTLQSDDNVTFSTFTEEEYDSDYIVGTQNTYTISYEDCTEYTFTYYTTSIGSSISDEELENYDFDAELNNYYNKYFRNPS